MDGIKNGRETRTNGIEQHSAQPSLIVLGIDYEVALSLYARSRGLQSTIMMISRLLPISYLIHDLS